MKNEQTHPIIANLPSCASCLLRQARRLPSRRLIHHPRWWYRWQLERLANGNMPDGENVEQVIGLSPRLSADERRIYDDFFYLCRLRGLTEEQILLLLLVWLSTDSSARPA